MVKLKIILWPLFSIIGLIILNLTLTINGLRITSSSSKKSSESDNINTNPSLLTDTSVRSDDSAASLLNPSQNAADNLGTGHDIKDRLDRLIQLISQLLDSTTTTTQQPRAPQPLPVHPDLKHELKSIFPYFLTGIQPIPQQPHYQAGAPYKVPRQSILPTGGNGGLEGFYSQYNLMPSFIPGSSSVPKSIQESESKLVCYFTGWDQWKQPPYKFTVPSVDPFLCTHLIYAFSKIGSDGRMTVYEHNAHEQYRELIALKTVNPKLKVMLAIGGWTHRAESFSQMAEYPEKRQIFIADVVRQLLEFGFDGFDIDWEYPGIEERGGRPIDKDNFIHLIREMREAFDRSGKKLILTAAVSTGYDKIEAGYHIRDLNKYLDFINLLGYDFHGAWENVTGINAPFNSTKDNLSLVWGIDYWLSHGAESSKLVVGLGTYGRAFTLTRPIPDNVVINDPRELIGLPMRDKGREGRLTLEPGVLSYYEICEHLNKDNWQKYWIKPEQAPVAFKGDQWVGYDDRISLGIKIDYIQANCLGGLMVWDLALDDHTGLNCGEGKYPLIKYMQSRASQLSVNCGIRETPPPSLTIITTETTTLSLPTPLVIQTIPPISQTSGSPIACSSIISPVSTMTLSKPEPKIIPVMSSSTRVSTIPTQVLTIPTQVLTIPTQVSTIPTQVLTIPTRVSTVPTQFSTIPTQVSTIPTQEKPSKDIFTTNKTTTPLGGIYFTTSPSSETTQKIIDETSSDTTQRITTTPQANVSKIDTRAITSVGVGLILPNPNNVSTLEVYCKKGWADKAFECPSEGTFRDKFSCGYYFECLYNPLTTDYILFYRSCADPIQTLFDPNTGICIWRDSPKPNQFNDDIDRRRKLLYDFDEDECPCDIFNIITAPTVASKTIITPETTVMTEPSTVILPPESRVVEEKPETIIMGKVIDILTQNFSSLVGPDNAKDKDYQLIRDECLLAIRQTFQCTKAGMFVDNADCRFYYECVHGMGDSLIQYRRPCSGASDSHVLQKPKGQGIVVFDPVIQTCVWSWQASLFFAAEKIEDTTTAPLLEGPNEKSLNVYFDESYPFRDNDEIIIQNEKDFEEITRLKDPFIAVKASKAVVKLSCPCNKFFITEEQTVSGAIPLTPRPIILDPKEPPITLEEVVPTPEKGSKTLICYFPSWFQWKSEPYKFTPKNIDPFLCTHIVYAFLSISDKNYSIVNIEHNTEEQHEQLNDLKKINPKLKILIGTGGWVFGAKIFSDLALKKETRQLFIDNTLMYLEKRNLDGIDLDWEYPGHGGQGGRLVEDKKNFPLLVKEMRETFDKAEKRIGKRLLITSAVSAGEENLLNGYDIPKLSKYLDLIGIMTYDMNGPWSNGAGHNSPLYDKTSDFSASFAMAYWHKMGAPLEKLLIGIPTYGRLLKLRNPAANKVKDPIMGTGPPGKYTGEAGTHAYYEVCEKLHNASSGWVKVFDEEAKSPYAYKDNIWMSYDDIKSVFLKIKYVIKKGYGGAIVWDLAQDDFIGSTCGTEKSPLIKTASKMLNIYQTPSENVNIHETGLPYIENVISDVKVQEIIELFNATSITTAVLDNDNTTSKIDAVMKTLMVLKELIESRVVTNGTNVTVNNYTRPSETLKDSFDLKSHGIITKYINSLNDLSLQKLDDKSSSANDFSLSQIKDIFFNNNALRLNNRHHESFNKSTNNNNNNKSKLNNNDSGSKHNSNLLITNGTASKKLVKHGMMLNMKVSNLMVQSINNSTINLINLDDSHDGFNKTIGFLDILNTDDNIDPLQSIDSRDNHNHVYYGDNLLTLDGNILNGNDSGSFQDYNTKKNVKTNEKANIMPKIISSTLFHNVSRTFVNPNINNISNNVLKRKKLLGAAKIESSDDSSKLSPRIKAIDDGQISRIIDSNILSGNDSGSPRQDSNIKNKKEFTISNMNFSTLINGSSQSFVVSRVNTGSSTLEVKKFLGAAKILSPDDSFKLSPRVEAIDDDGKISRRNTDNVIVIKGKGILDADNNEGVNVINLSDVKKNKDGIVVLPLKRRNFESSTALNLTRVLDIQFKPGLGIDPASFNWSIIKGKPENNNNNATTILVKEEVIYLRFVDPIPSELIGDDSTTVLPETTSRHPNSNPKELKIAKFKTKINETSFSSSTNIIPSFHLARIVYGRIKTRLPSNNSVQGELFSNVLEDQEDSVTAFNNDDNNATENLLSMYYAYYNNNNNDERNTRENSTIVKPHPSSSYLVFNVSSFELLAKLLPGNNLNNNSKEGIKTEARAKILFRPVFVEETNPDEHNAILSKVLRLDQEFVLQKGRNMS